MPRRKQSTPPPPDDDDLAPNTRAALELAIAIALKSDRATRQQIESMLRERPWREVAEFAAYGCQCDALRLKPWQPPPCHAHLDDDDGEAGPIMGRRAAAMLLRKMLLLAVDRWHPDPLAAIERAEAARVA